MDNEGTTFQIISDLHLELNSQYAGYTITPTSPYLILAGDVGSLSDYSLYLSFLQRHTPLYKRIFLALGNHEFHHLSYPDALSLAQRLETEDGVEGKLTLLHRTRVDLPLHEGQNDAHESESRDISDEGVIILGCTLWTAIPSSASTAVQSRVKDYAHIRAWSIEAHNSHHAEDKTWLRDQLALIHSESLISGKGKKVLIVTHHASSNIGTSNPLHASNPWSSAFSTALVEEEAKGWEGWGNVGAWVFGHTHWTTELMIEGVKVVSNQRGYVRGSLDGVNVVAGEKKDRKHVFDERRTLCL